MGFIKLSKQKFESITSSMRCKYKTETYVIVIMLINNKSTQVMSEVDIKTSIRMYFRPIYDRDNPAIDKFNETLSLKN